MTPKKVAEIPARLSGLGKWITVTLTTLAALIGLLVNARNLGLAPWLPTLGVSIADLAARRVLIAPAADTMRAIGDTMHFAVTVTDDHGATISGTTLRWATDDSSVATVDSAGEVVARGPGNATIVASVREHHAAARVTVRQAVRAVRIAGDSVVRLAEGGSAQLVAQGLDARGRPVPGRDVTWTAADIAVVTIAPGGIARAAGPGRTTLTATIDGASATVAADVALSAASAQLTGGDGQRAPAGAKLAQPVQLLVLSRGGRPVPNAAIAFSTAGDEGQADPAKTATDKAGRARTTWTLGAHPGRQRLTATVDGMDSVVVVTAEADPVPANTLVQAARPVPGGTAGTRMPEAVGIRVTDLAGAAEVDVPVTWTALDGGTVDAESARTDSLGQAWAQWTLGPKAGKQRVRVQVGNPRTMPAFTLTAMAAANAAAKITVVSGGGQRARVGSALAEPVVVRLTDKDGNVVAGATVQVTASDGVVEDSTPQSDARGIVRARWVLGHKAGVQFLAFGLGTLAPLHVPARAKALAPANAAFGAMPVSGAAGRTLAKAVTVTVTDVYGNGVADAPVAFLVASGSVTPARVMTDSSGRASTRWTLGTKAGEQPITAVVRGTSVKSAAVVEAKKGER
ncbi:MAG TPA: Ig-like domain-containing protein [Gemmatimonadaceae bacterium]|nr:Ig-like domain-containing protein [Gemmatimonadaceae bacterium]